jgi:hypothetical protein
MATQPANDRQSAARGLAVTGTISGLATSEAGQVPSRLGSATKRKRPAATLPRDELAAARAQRARDRTAVEQWVEKRLDELEHVESFRVPRLHVVITGTLPAASALALIEQWSERSFRERGTPWVAMPLETWLNYTGLDEADWLAARDILRGLGLIQERRRFDLEREEIVTEFAFAAEVFSQEVAGVREMLREQAWQDRRATQPLADDWRLTADTAIQQP